MTTVKGLSLEEMRLQDYAAEAAASASAAARGSGDRAAALARRLAEPQPAVATYRVPRGSIWSADTAISESRHYDRKVPVFILGTLHRDRLWHLPGHHVDNVVALLLQAGAPPEPVAYAAASFVAMDTVTNAATTPHWHALVDQLVHVLQLLRPHMAVCDLDDSPLRILRSDLQEMRAASPAADVAASLESAVQRLQTMGC